MKNGKREGKEGEGTNLRYLFLMSMVPELIEWPIFYKYIISKKYSKLNGSHFIYPMWVIPLQYGISNTHAINRCLLRKIYAIFQTSIFE